MVGVHTKSLSSPQQRRTRSCKEPGSISPTPSYNTKSVDSEVGLRQTPAQHNARSSTVLGSTLVAQSLLVLRLLRSRVLLLLLLLELRLLLSGELLLLQSELGSLSLSLARRSLLSGGVAKVGVVESRGAVEAAGGVELEELVEEVEGCEGG